MHARIFLVAFLFLAFSGSVLAQSSPPAAADARILAGSYDLFSLQRVRLGGDLPARSNRMVITQAGGDSFRVASPQDVTEPRITWRGQGILKGRSGFYTWKFEDGKTGRTDFVLTADNDLIGYVQISDLALQATFNWWYLAKRRP